jgi:hypothetical protein|tara:strand:- start:296 stop:427 length:132 start_codon:yes stop_codon:yes gene_type:complete
VTHEINVVNKKETKNIMALEFIINFVKEIIGMCHKKNEYDIFP